MGLLRNLEKRGQREGEQEKMREKGSFEMGTRNPFKDYSQSHSPNRKFFSFAIFVLLSIALFRLYFYPLPLLRSPSYHLSHIYINSSPSSSSSSLPLIPLLPSLSFSKEEERSDEALCDYTDGEWIHDEMGPLYNTTTCGTIKEGQNCISHGRPDFDYLYWRWKPRQCDLPRFDPNRFLQLLENKHLAFVGDSMARNQLESLLCMLATVSTPNLIYRNGEDNKFRRWHFDSHNITVSVYWSPFLVKGIEKSVASGLNHNKLYLDSVDERWAADLESMDMIVLSIGHWFLHPAVYFEGDSVLGCHLCIGLNHTQIGFFDVFRKAIRTTLKTIVERRGENGNGNGIDVILTTFSPAHFEGRLWDSLGACNQTQPYKEEEKVLEITDVEMRKGEIEEVEAMKVNGKQLKGFRLEALDITRLSSLRPDGHPGAYMYANPFANGIPEHVHNDCVHWCLPGPVDTWNQILLEVYKRWEVQSRRGG